MITLLILLAAGSFSLSAQRGMRGMRSDTARMKRPVIEQMQMNRMMQRTDSIHDRMMGRDMMRIRMHDMRSHMFPMRDMRRPFRSGMQPGRDIWRPAPGMRYRGMDALPGMRRGVPGMRAMGNIPDLTDKQKKEVEELRQKHQNEMQEFRTDMQEKMKAMRDSHRSKLMDLLTDEQKKWFEDNSPKPPDK